VYETAKETPMYRSVLWTLWEREWEYAYSGVKVVLCMQDVSTEFINKAKQDKLLPDLHAILERLG